MKGLLEDMYYGWAKYVYQEQAATAKQLAKVAQKKADAMGKAAELDAEESAMQVALATSQEETDQEEREEKAEKEQKRVQADKRAMDSREREAEEAETVRKREMQEIVDSFKRWCDEEG